MQKVIWDENKNTLMVAHYSAAVFVEQDSQACFETSIEPLSYITRCIQLCFAPNDE